MDLLFIDLLPYSLIKKKNQKQTKDNQTNKKRKKKS